MPDRRFRHPWQVVRLDADTTTALCSHRWQITAGWCADRRDFLDVLRPRSTAYYGVRRNTYVPPAVAACEHRTTHGPHWHGRYLDRRCRGAGLAGECEHGVGILDECKACTAARS